MEEWKKEYLRSHPERHNIMHSTNKMKIEVGDVVFIKREKKNKGKWSIEIVEDLCMGKDDEIRGVRLQKPKSYIERLIQYFYPLKLHCDMEKSTSKSKNTSYKKLNVDAKKFKSRRTAAATSEM